MRRPRRRRRRRRPPTHHRPRPRPLARAAAMKPHFTDADADLEVAMEQGFERTRGGFMTRLREALAAGPDGASWDDVEETLIAGDVGAALAMDIVEKARGRRDPDGAEAAVRAELAALLVARDRAWEPRPSVAGGPAIV